MAEMIMTARCIAAAPSWQRLAAFIVITVAVAFTGIQLASSAPNAALRAALVATLFTALATGAGALPVLVVRNISDAVRDAMLGFGAGVMLAASFFSLLAPALASGTQIAGSPAGGVLIAAAGVIIGAAMLMAADRWLPHEHFIKGREGGTENPAVRNAQGLWLFVVAITLHNIPEGLAVGVAQGSASGAAITLGIAIQNMPEGLIVAIALVTLGISRWKAAALALATGMAEPLGGLIGAGAISYATVMLPWGLAFAAGAMLFVISHEIIPETHRNGNERVATIGLIGGFVLMMLFDTILR
jgi:ZIP family zinc transporter